MSHDLFQRITRAGWIMASVSAAAAGAFFGLRWAAALGVGFAWMYLNVFFLMRLLETAVNPESVTAGRKHVAVFALLKFPVIYLTGFFILQSRYFPMNGLLAGMTVFFASLAAARLVPHRHCCKGMPDGPRMPL